LGVCHSVHILDSLPRQVNAGVRPVARQFPISRRTKSYGSLKQSVDQSTN